MHFGHTYHTIHPMVINSSVAVKMSTVSVAGEVTTAEMTNMEIFLTLSEACPAGSPRLELNKKYLVMGKTNNLSKR